MSKTTAKKKTVGDLYTAKVGVTRIAFYDHSDRLIVELPLVPAELAIEKMEEETGRDTAKMMERIVDWLKQEYSVVIDASTAFIIWESVRVGFNDFKKKATLSLRLQGSTQSTPLD